LDYDQLPVRLLAEVKQQATRLHAQALQLHAQARQLKRLTRLADQAQRPSRRSASAGARQPRFLHIATDAGMMQA
jgi:hypothetical protein